MLNQKSWNYHIALILFIYSTHYLEDHRYILLWTFGIGRPLHVSGVYDQNPNQNDIVIFDNSGTARYILVVGELRSVVLVRLRPIPRAGSGLSMELWGR